MSVIELGTRREVCWDEALFEHAENISVRMHKPEFRNTALTCDMPWEGNTCGYFSLIRDGSLLRLYYRGADMPLTYDGDSIAVPEDNGHYCYAESLDGKTFRRVPLHICDHHGSGTSPENNILMDEAFDNLTVFLDKNPACPKAERFKAVSGYCSPEYQALMLYTSADGIHFEKKGELLDDGAYDSMNVPFWDETRKLYYLYYRGIHRESGVGDGKWLDGDDSGKIIRDVRVRTSPDFQIWSEPRRIEFAPGQEDYQLYTNQVQPYYRAPHVFLGMPTRYTERLTDIRNFPHLPDYRNRKVLVKDDGRSGYAFTDCVLMTTRDGVNFRRTDEAFLTPGIQNGINWYYGDCYPALGIVETPSDRPGYPNELSIYVHENYRAKPVQLQRYALRVDGFFSWHGDYSEGTVLTKPVTFEGENLEINFATSCLGHVRIELCGEDGMPIPGYDSGRLFGDELERPVDFDAPLAALKGKPVRIRFTLKDAELYSFRFAPAYLI